MNSAQFFIFLSPQNISRLSVILTLFVSCYPCLSLATSNITFITQSWFQNIYLDIYWLFYKTKVEHIRLSQVAIIILSWVK